MAKPPDTNRSIAIRLKHDARLASSQTKREAVRAFHDLGTEFMDTERGRLSKIASTKGLTADKLSKAVTFAKKYTAEQLNQLCRPDPAERFQLGIGHVRVLVGMKADTKEAIQKRLDLEQLAEKNEWTAQRLNREIQDTSVKDPPKPETQNEQGKAPRKTGGRSFKRPFGLKEAFGEFRLVAQAFDRRLAQWEDPGSPSILQVEPIRAFAAAAGDRQTVVAIKESLAKIAASATRIVRILDEGLAMGTADLPPAIGPPETGVPQ